MVDSKIQQVLASISPTANQPDGFVEGEAIVADHLASSSWLYEFCCAAVIRRQAGHVLVAETLSFLDEMDIGRLLEFVADKHSVDGVADMLENIAFQFPEQMPRSFVSDMVEFRDWQENAEPFGAVGGYHMIFAGGSPISALGARPSQLHHPTWHLETTEVEIRVGGEGVETCPTCSQRQVHLASVNTQLDNVRMSLPQLVLETCPSCWARGPIYYQHNEQGFPRRIQPLDLEEVDWVHHPMQPVTIKLARTPLRWQRQSVNIANGRHNLFKIGGLPTWVQYGDVPVEPNSGRQMEFLLQFDSGLETIDGGEMLWGSGGILYIFWDDETRTSCHFGQWT